VSNDQPIPHHDNGAEQAVLGAMMLAPDVISTVEITLKASDFYRPAHGLIYRTILELRDRREPTDPVFLTAHLTELGKITQVGGANYLHNCYAACPTTANAGYYAQIVAGCSALRRLTTVGQQIQDLAAAGHYENADTILDKARGLLTDLEVGGSTGTDRTWAELVPMMLDKIEEAAMQPDGIIGVCTGLPDVDEALEGMRDGQLVVIGARPGVGKSVFLRGIAEHAAMRMGLRTLMFSLEMSDTEAATCITSSFLELPLAKIRSGKELVDEDWSNLVAFLGESSGAPLHIDANPKVTLPYVRSTARRIVAQYGKLDLILIDYLQLMTSANGREPREQQVSGMSRGLKLLAKELGIPIITAAQLNRESEKRSDKRPQLADLRESGAVEQDADTVVLLHREDVHDPESPKAGECDVIIAKSRHARQQTISVAAQLHVSRFASFRQPSSGGRR
jgi:replicative DNA helicase